MAIILSAALLGAFATTVSAHGHVTGVVADGTYFQGYDPAMQFEANKPAVVGWSCPECLDNGFVSPDMYSTTKIACHKNATPGKASAKVSAGGKIEVQWTAWPESHKGPVIDYLAKCNGDCSTTTAEALRFFKINQGGLINGASNTWATDQLIASNNSWTVPIPASLAPGNYVLRHEIIALHAAGEVNGAQNYPQCINIQVTGGGSAAPAGVAATALYKATDPGILFSLYQAVSGYVIPGPALFNGGGGSAPISSSRPATTATPTPVRTSNAVPTPTSIRTTLSTATTLPQPSATAGGNTAPVAKYQQCGGRNHVGSTTCVSGTVCTELNEYYFQCL